MKKGFTLIELLAVIIILAILMVIAVPSVLNTLNTAKLNTFKTQAQSIWKAAEQKYIIDSMTGVQKSCYDLTNPLDLASISSTTSYKVTLGTDGKATSITVQDTAQKFKATGTTVDGITATSDDTLTSSTAALAC